MSTNSGPITLYTIIFNVYSYKIFNCPQNDSNNQHWNYVFFCVYQNILLHLFYMTRILNRFCICTFSYVFCMYILIFFSVFYYYSNICNSLDFNIYSNAPFSIFYDYMLHNQIKHIFYWLWDKCLSFFERNFNEEIKK